MPAGRGVGRSGSGSAGGSVTTHEAAADPHTGYQLESLYDAKGDSIYASADNIPAKVTIGANATIPVADSTQTAGVKWAYGNGVHKHIRRTSGNITINTVTLINLDTGLDLVLPAATGDVIQVSICAQWNNEAVNGILDVATIVSAAPVTYFSNATGTSASFGLAGWIGFNNAYVVAGAPAHLTLVPGDISAGTVTLRLRTRTDTATNKILIADTNVPFHFAARNLGPAAS